MLPWFPLLLQTPLAHTALALRMRARSIQLSTGT